MGRSEGDCGGVRKRWREEMERCGAKAGEAGMEGYMVEGMVLSGSDL